MNSDIILSKVGDEHPNDNNLPRGIKAIIVGDNIIFVRRLGGRFVPVSQEDQDKFTQLHVIKCPPKTL